MQERECPHVEGGSEKLNRDVEVHEPSIATCSGEGPLSLGQCSGMTPERLGLPVQGVSAWPGERLTQRT